ncbi:sialate O-acetylesterase [Bacteroides intestinalis]|jgi:sialate O-acetylesterase|uniref:sialate O-acetylesterase n=1 Tax=Bacteroides intestinalis TaxID=329854 RepID=UPI0022E3C179|nr:sialate O-acetylesterase [Bacteroides intestinalis]
MKSPRFVIVLLVSFLLLAEGTQAKITIPSFFSNGMVLQQQSMVAIWGSSDKQQQKVAVKTSWNNRKYTTRTDELGNWKVKVETPVYGGPYIVEISDGEVVCIENVLIGEVWLCSGQSNMDMRVSGRYGDPVLGSLDAIVTSENPEIRMFMVGSKMTSAPLTDCEGIWQEASSETVPDFSAAGYFFARKLNEVLRIPVGIIHASYGGSRVEAWMSKEAIEPYRDLEDVHNASILYNGMLSPVVGYGIRGCLWYQGEANVDAPDLYTQLFPSLVNDWRKKWGMGEFPFYYAQIAPFNYNKGEGKGKNSAYLREAQTACLKLIPSSGMIILTDIGDARTIHPMEKEAVGNRFAYMALGRTYGKKGFPTTGPLYKSMQTEGNKITLLFDEMGKGLTTYRQQLTGFEVAGEDKVFHPANARFGKDAQTVIVSSPEVEQPVAVRYAFKDYIKGTLYNMSGLPASSFRTDNW